MGADKPGTKRRDVGIAEIYSALIRGNHGRTPSEIGNRHTWRQMKLFFDEIQKAKSRDRLARIDDVNAGFAGGKHAEKLKHDLES